MNNRLRRAAEFLVGSIVAVVAALLGLTLWPGSQKSGHSEAPQILLMSSFVIAVLVLGWWTGRLLA